MPASLRSLLRPCAFGDPGLSADYRSYIIEGDSDECAVESPTGGVARRRL